MTFRIDLETVCSDYRKLAIVGTAKAAGKTTTFNHLLHRLHARGETLGMSSIGLDGDAVDGSTLQAKPLICPPVGSFVATSMGRALCSPDALRLVAETPFHNALGPVAIYRVVQMDYIEISGPSHAHEVRHLVDMFTALGCDRVLIDGAADRRAFLTEGFDGVVVAAGADDADDVDPVGQVLTFLHQLLLPPAPERWRHPMGGCPAALIEGGASVPWPIGSFLSDLDRLAAWLPDDTAALWVPGAVTDRLLETLLTAGKPLPLIVQAGTHLLVHRDQYEHYLAAGGAIYATQSLRPVAVTIHPDGLRRRGVNPFELVRSIHETFPLLPILDVMATA